jgi:hypothetical protein
MARIKQQATCHPDRPNCAFGLCQPCYVQSRRHAPLDDGTIRATCHPDRRHWSNGLCEPCYNKQWRENDSKREQRLAKRRESSKAHYAAWRAVNPTQPRPKDIRTARVKQQSICHPLKREYSRGLCRACYMRERRATSGGIPPTCGHPERRNYAHGKCHACYQSWRRNTDPAKLEASRESGRKHREAVRSNPEKHESVKALQRESRRKSEFGISGEQYGAALDEQERRCAICRSVFTEYQDGNPPCIDHCHDKNEFRGLLCRGCNLMLGYAKDSIEILQSAIRYLEAFNAKVPEKILSTRALLGC